MQTDQAVNFHNQDLFHSGITIGRFRAVTTLQYAIQAIQCFLVSSIVFQCQRIVTVALQIHRAPFQHFTCTPQFLFILFPFFQFIHQYFHQRCIFNIQLGDITQDLYSGINRFSFIEILRHIIIEGSFILVLFPFLQVSSIRLFTFFQRLHIGLVRYRYYGFRSIPVICSSSISGNITDCNIETICHSTVRRRPVIRCGSTGCIAFLLGDRFNK
ncbi:hypothetical protein D9M68_539640 [compost metagenome]